MENGQKTLEQWRAEIDLLDGELLRVLNRRAAIACEIAGLKLTLGIPACDPEREQQVLTRIASRNQGPLENSSVLAIFASIIHETRRLGTQRMEELGGMAPDERVQDARENFEVKNVSKQFS